MKTYYQNGIVEDVHYFIDKTDEFQIQELDNETQNRFTYPEDSINYALDGEICVLYDTLRDMIFDDIDQYYQELSILPIWVQEAGQNSDCVISVDTFNEWISESNIPNLFGRLSVSSWNHSEFTMRNGRCICSILQNNCYFRQRRKVPRFNKSQRNNFCTFRKFYTSLCYD